MIIKLLKITSINYIDRILGFIFGVLRVYILLLIAFAILILPLENTDRPDYIKVSNISPIIEKSVNLTLNNIPQLKYYISRGQETSSEIINPEENGINKNE
jgi:membrane protein required for colicin V production